MQRACLAFVVAAVFLTQAVAQEKPVVDSPKSATPADINKNFLDPDLNPEEWIERFEIESREVFSHRKEVLQAVGLQAGQAIADVGSGTGLYLAAFARAVGEQGKVFAVEHLAQVRRVSAESSEATRTRQRHRRALQRGFRRTGAE